MHLQLLIVSNNWGAHQTGRLLFYLTSYYQPLRSRYPFIPFGILFLVMVIVFFIFRRIRNKKQTMHHIYLKQKEVRKLGEDAE